MKTMRILNILIFVSNCLYVNCCGKQGPTDLCPNWDNIDSCAILYEDGLCRGKASKINEDQTQLDRNTHFASAVVKRNCILTLRYYWQGKFYVRQASAMHNYNANLFGGTYYPYSPSSDNTQRKHYVSSLSCSCNHYRGCPKPRNLKPRTENDKSMCAVLYQYGTNDPLTSCYGQSRDVYNGERMRKIDYKKYNDIGSIVVRDGCALRRYIGNDFTDYHETKHISGQSSEYKGVIARAYYTHSYICECEFPAVPSCTIKENWEKIMVCSNPDNSKPTCEHWISEGVSVGTTTTNQHGETQNYELTFGVELKEIFKLNSFSSNYGYNWQTTKAFSKTENKETKNRVVFTIPVGETYALYQLVGECGQNDVKTKYYEIRNERNGDVTERKEAN